MTVQIRHTIKSERKPPEGFRVYCTCGEWETTQTKKVHGMIVAQIHLSRNDPSHPYYQRPKAVARLTVSHGH